MLKTLGWRETEQIKNVKTEEITENMELDESTFCRRIITPWYDSYPVGWILILWAIFVLIFALIGLDIAMSTETFYRYLWFSVMLACLAAVIIISVLFRMIRYSIKGL